MMSNGDGRVKKTFETALDGTIYWTLSLYISSDRVAAAAGQPGYPLDHEVFKRAQANHLPSQLLRDAIDPLFNDIADREVLGEVQELLFSAIDVPEGSDLKEIGKAIRGAEQLTFHPKQDITWSTEGLAYRASPPNLDQDRKVSFRRFWLVHNNGALSYHMSFKHCYAEVDGEGYGPETYYFISLLQKLAAPKEFSLSREKRKSLKPSSVFEADLGIDPLDTLTVSDEHHARSRFWPFVKRRMINDAERLFDRIANSLGTSRAADLDDLIEQVPFIEVPGLSIPKSRFMFVFHDERFFKRLMPVDSVTGEALPRKLMVQDRCYAPFQKELQARVDAAADKDDGSAIELDQTYWSWVTTQPQYAEWISGELPRLRRSNGSNFENLDELEAAMQEGEVQLTQDDRGRPSSPRMIKVPSYTSKRKDCLDYLFLSGFNQNIIDFMNQDTSEILDATDPIYPASRDQSDERFFVRYANHRAIITYVPKSRSLESGNDYIGTCPYAFLIHAISLHNEYLARGHEARSMARIERIEWLVTAEKDRRRLSSSARYLEKIEPLLGDDDYDRAEMAINRAKLADYSEYERFRYINPFRYDTEREVFAKLEELRGIVRKKETLSLALESLEDHAHDLQRRHQRKIDADSTRREIILASLLGATGIFGAGQMIYWIGESAAADPYSYHSRPAEPLNLDVMGVFQVKLDGEWMMSVTESVMLYALLIFILAIAWLLGSAIWRWAFKRWHRAISKYARNTLRN